MHTTDLTDTTDQFLEQHRVTALFQEPAGARRAVRTLERMGIQPDELSIPHVADSTAKDSDRYPAWVRQLRWNVGLGSTVLAIGLLSMLGQFGQLDITTIAAVFIATALVGAAWARTQVGESPAWRATFRTPTDRPIEAVVQSNRGITVTEAVERLWSMSPIDLVRG